MTNTKRGIDISNNQGNIDFAQVANAVDFVIIRAGWGSDITSQDDPKFMEYVQGCIANNIPFGLYLYSYALNASDLQSEIAHMVRLYNSVSSTGLLQYGLWFDMEDADGYKANHGQPMSQYGALYSQFCNDWVDGVHAATGKMCGVYASLSPLSNELSSIRADIKKWVAYWSNTEPIFPNMYLWQNSNNGSIPGIAGRVDTDVLMSDAPSSSRADEHNSSSSTTPNTQDSIDIEAYAMRTIRGDFGNGQDRINAFHAMGFSDDLINQIQGRVDEILAPVETSSNESALWLGKDISIRLGACDLNSGCQYAGFVYETTYQIIELQDRGVVFGRDGVVTGVVAYSDVI